MSITIYKPLVLLWCKKCGRKTDHVLINVANPAKGELKETYECQECEQTKKVYELDPLSHFSNLVQPLAMKGLDEPQQKEPTVLSPTSEPKSKTHLTNGLLTGLGMGVCVFGLYVWQSVNLLSRTLFPTLENQGYVIPASVSVNFNQITIITTIITLIGCVLIFVGMVNESLLS